MYLYVAPRLHFLELHEVSEEVFVGGEQGGVGRGWGDHEVHWETFSSDHDVKTV